MTLIIAQVFRWEILKNSGTNDEAIERCNKLVRRYQKAMKDYYNL